MSRPTILYQNPISIIGVQEGYAAGTISGGIMTGDWNTAAIYRLSAAPTTSTFTIRVNNLPTTTNKAYTFTTIIPQGTTQAGYGATLQIGGVTTTINWQNNSTPAGTTGTNKTDVETLTLLYSGTTWTALGNYASYGA